MKRIIRMLACIVIIFAILPITAFADIGPKPSVVIDFSGLEGEIYYATLLSETTSTGPYSVLTDRSEVHAHYDEDDPDYPIVRKFIEYEDADGFYFIQFLQNCSETQQLVWGYHPPERFKILLYFPETDTFLTGEAIYEKYAFDSYFHATISNGGISVEKSYDYAAEVPSLLIRIALTIIIELGVALLFGFRERKIFRFIAIVNVITQIALNLALNIINFFSGSLGFFLFYILLEIAVFIIEAILYKVYLSKHSETLLPNRSPTIYALVSNTVSFFVGLYLATHIPRIF